MKPITEHPEFPVEKEKYMSHFKSFNNPNELIEKHWVYAALNGAYDNGAKAAQSILQKEYERFEIWRFNNVHATYKEVDGTLTYRLRGAGTGSKNRITYNQLLQLFREREG